MQDPLTLLLLGPTANGVPGLLGVATLLLHIEDAQIDFGHSCSSRAQPVPLISPAGDMIGCITAAARVVCCQPAALEQLKGQASQDSVSSTTARVSSYSSATPAALQGPVHHGLASTSLSPAEPPAALLRTVSAAVQTDAPHTSLANSHPLQEKVQQSLQPPQEMLQQEAGTAASSEGGKKDIRASQPPDFPSVVQSPHFHIYLPGPGTVHAAPPEQPAIQHPLVISTLQPTFNFAAPQQLQAAPQAEPLPEKASPATAVLAPVTVNTRQRLQEAQPAVTQGSTAVAGKLLSKVDPAAVQGTTAVAHDIQQTIQKLHAAVEPVAAPGETGKAVQVFKAVDDFESWRPMTSVPLSNGTAVAADRRGLGINGTAAEASAESVTTGQCCKGAHAPAFRQPKSCNHQVLCRCLTCAMHTVPHCLCPLEKPKGIVQRQVTALKACGGADAS